MSVLKRQNYHCPLKLMQASEVFNTLMEALPDGYPDLRKVKKGKGRNSDMVGLTRAAVGEKMKLLGFRWQEIATLMNIDRSTCYHWGSEKFLKKRSVDQDFLRLEAYLKGVTDYEIPIPDHTGIYSAVGLLSGIGFNPER